jgi:glucose-6-phosphate isomerase
MRVWKGVLPEPDVRKIEDMRSVLKEPDCRCTSPLYFMYRDLAISEKDRQWLVSKRLRYDITVIPPRTICGELVKTKGHYHPENSSGTGYPELYEVLEGYAHYLLQKEDLTDIVLVDAGKGDVVLIPPFYGHVTINPGDDDLVMANIVSDEFKSIYGPYEKMQGAAYYETEPDIFEKNALYPDIPVIRKIPAKETVKKLGIRGSLYELVEKKWEGLSFLNEPQDYDLVI